MFLSLSFPIFVFRFVYNCTVAVVVCVANNVTHRRIISDAPCLLYPFDPLHTGRRKWNDERRRAEIHRVAIKNNEEERRKKKWLDQNGIKVGKRERVYFFPDAMDIFPRRGGGIFFGTVSHTGHDFLFSPFFFLLFSRRSGKKIGQKRSVFIQLFPPFFSFHTEKK